MRVCTGEGGEAAELSLSSDADECRDPRAYPSSCTHRAVLSWHCLA